jgi:hypothetical protein
MDVAATMDQMTVIQLMKRRVANGQRHREDGALRVEDSNRSFPRQANKIRRSAPSREIGLVAYPGGRAQTNCAAKRGHEGPFGAVPVRLESRRNFQAEEGCSGL